MDKRQKMYSYHDDVEPSVLLVGLLYRDLPGKKNFRETEKSQKK